MRCKMILNSEEYEISKLIIKQNNIFSRLNEKKLDELLSIFKFEKWKKNTEIIGPNSPKKFYIILSGKVKAYYVNLENNRELTIFLLSTHDIFDVISLLDKKERTINYTSLDNTVMLSAPINTVRMWVEKHPEINKTLLPYLGERMSFLEENLRDTVISDIPTRLAKLILRNIDNDLPEMNLINDLSHTELAKIIGSTRAVINRHLQEFKKNGLIDVQRKKITVLDVNKLLKKVEKKI